MARILTLLGLSLVLGSVGFAARAETMPAPIPPPAKNDYANPQTWLCLPGRTDACAVDNTSTVVAADGTMSKEAWKADPKAPVDCF